MKPTKIFLYLYKTKIIYIIISLIILTITVQIVDFIELTQANINKSNFSFNDIIKMSFLKMPYLINEILPFVIIISTSFYFKSLIDNNELVSIRNLGLSIFNIFYPVAFAVLTIGIFSLIFLNPISSISMNYLQKIKNNDEKTSVIKLSNDNIWIKNKLEDKILYINAKNININKMLLTDIMIIDNTNNNQKLFFEKLNKNTKYNYKNIRINFNQKDILNSLQYYKYTPFYKYYSYVKSMKKLNYLSSEIILYFLSEIFKPLLLISISFVVTGYVAKFKRNENFFKTIFIAISIGFIIFLIDKVIYSINAKSILSYIFVILAIPITSIILGIIFMLRVEKG